MPHIIAKTLEKPTLPQEKDGFLFEFISQGDEGIIGVKKDNYRFLLEFFPHKKGVLIKTDKTTRVPNLNINKLAIKAFSMISDCVVVQSNIESLRMEREYKALVSREDLLEKLPKNKKIWLEIGFGSGIHISNNAKKEKDIVHIGIEIHKPSIEQLLRQCEIEKIENILVLSDDARVILETLPADSVERIFVHFPVPWDKSPTKRIFSDNFIRESSKVLVKNGTLELRTDSDNYYEFVTELYHNLGKFDLRIRKNADLDVISKYETRWRKQEKNIYDVIYCNDEEGGKDEEIIDFSFPKIEDFYKKVSRFTDKGFIGNNFLVKLIKTYQIDNNRKIYKFVMGKHAFPLSIYILDDSGEISYFPKLPFFARENFLAHKEIIKTES